MVITGGEINVNSASHAIHCQDEIEISGGKFTFKSVVMVSMVVLIDMLLKN